MSTSVSDKIVFTPVIKELIERRLESANSELYELAWRVGWEVRKVDFKPVTAAYPREKIGLIRIPIVIEYRAPASLEKITEEYVYTISTRVAANLVPVLSRFTLYVKDARSGEDEERFNKIVSNADSFISVAVASILVSHVAGALVAGTTVRLPKAFTFSPKAVATAFTKLTRSATWLCSTVRPD
jgi:hypothetical protein